MGTRERRERSNASDELLAELFRGALRVSNTSEEEIALAAVGGFGRGELSPGSDLDIIFIHTGLSEEKLSIFVKAMLLKKPCWAVK